MAKKSMIERDRKRSRLITKYASKREQLLLEIKQASSMEEKLALHRKLQKLEEIFQLNEKIQKLPRNSAPTRSHNRCTITGRPRGYFRDFGLSRHVLREYALQGLLPGVVKASW